MSVSLRLPAVLGCLMAMALCGCGGSQKTPPTEPSGSRYVVLRVGGESVVDDNDVRLVLTEIVEDARCGTSENCLLSGVFRARATLIGGGGEAQNFVSQLGKPETLPASGKRSRYEIYVADVSPEKSTLSQPVDQKEYRVTFHTLRLP